ncbi:hypothetical protein SAMN02745121_08844, partial [Nannocystis exedens]
MSTLVCEQRVLGLAGARLRDFELGALAPAFFTEERHGSDVRDVR